MEIMNEPKKLYRSKANRMLAGVCAGMAEYFNVDPTLVRVIAIFLLLTPCVPALLAYLIAWALIPEKK